MSSNAADRAREVVAVERLDVLNLERLDVQLLEAEERDRVLDGEAEGVGGEEVGRA